MYIYYFKDAISNYYFWLSHDLSFDFPVLHESDYFRASEWSWVHTHTNTYLGFQVRMDPYNEETAAKYMMDAINEDTGVNAAEKFGAEEARTDDSFLNMSADGSDRDDDFATTPAPQLIPVRALDRILGWLNYIRFASN